MDSAELHNRFRFHPATTDQRRNDHEAVRIDCDHLAYQLNDRLPEGREKALARQPEESP